MRKHVELKRTWNSTFYSFDTKLRALWFILRETLDSKWFLFIVIFLLADLWSLQHWLRHQVGWLGSAPRRDELIKNYKMAEEASSSKTIKWRKMKPTAVLMPRPHTLQLTLWSQWGGERVTTGNSWEDQQVERAGEERASYTTWRIRERCRETASEWSCCQEAAVDPAGADGLTSERHKVVSNQSSPFWSLKVRKRAAATTVTQRLTTPTKPDKDHLLINS